MKYASRYLRLIRIHQWVKNAFIFLPGFFGQYFVNLENILAVVGGFFAFSFTASSIYILNDFLDIERDRLHPEKSKRPLASGEVSSKEAFILLTILLSAAIYISAHMNIYFISVLIGYFSLNIIYSAFLKKVSIVDVTIIAVGFLLRVYAGGAILEIEISKWLALMTFLLAMLLAFAKRRDDILIQFDLKKENQLSLRESLKGYNLEFINAAMTVLGAVIIVSYIMYTISAEVVERLENDYIYGTAFYVVLGILRYLQLTIVENKSGSPTYVLLKDLFIQIVLLAWLISFVFLLYVL